MRTSCSGRAMRSACRSCATGTSSGSPARPAVIGGRSIRTSSVRVFPSTRFSGTSRNASPASNAAAAASAHGRYGTNPAIDRPSSRDNPPRYSAPTAPGHPRFELSPPLALTPNARCVLYYKTILARGPAARPRCIPPACGPPPSAPVRQVLFPGPTAHAGTSAKRADGSASVSGPATVSPVDHSQGDFGSPLHPIDSGAFLSPRPQTMSWRPTLRGLDAAILSKMDHDQGAYRRPLNPARRAWRVCLLHLHRTMHEQMPVRPTSSAARPRGYASSFATRSNRSVSCPFPLPRYRSLKETLGFHQLGPQIHQDHSSLLR